MIIRNNDFNILTKKSKDRYALLISRRAQLSKNALVLKNEFNLMEDQLEKVFLLPHIVCSESYVKAFQYKVPHSILYTNAKLCKIGFETQKYICIKSKALKEFHPKNGPYCFLYDINFYMYLQYIYFSTH